MYRWRSLIGLKQPLFKVLASQTKSCSGIQKPFNSILLQRFMSQTAGDVSCIYRNGFVVLTLPMPSRKENCEFTLRPVSHTVKDLVSFAKEEDGGIDRLAVYSMEGVRISSSTPIDILVQQDFVIHLNDTKIDIVPPKPEVFPAVLDDQLSNTKNLISQLYTDLNVEEYKENRERALKVHLESLKNDLSPLERQKALIDARAATRTNILVWAGLGYMAWQFGFLARLTWWEYSWDIMEPVTYFVTYGTSLLCYAYFVLTREDSNYPEMKSRSHLLNFYRESEKNKFDVNEYNVKKEMVAKLEAELEFFNSYPQTAVNAQASE